MKRENEEQRKALTRLTAALFHLDDLDCTVIGSRTGKRNPIIEIEPPKNGSRKWLRPTVHQRVVLKGGRTDTVFVARVKGVEVRWTEYRSLIASVAAGALT